MLHKDLLSECKTDASQDNHYQVPWKRPKRRPMPVSRPVISARGQAYLDEVLASGWWGYGPVARHLERMITGSLGNSHNTLATSSCTAALHLALLAENIGPGDEVILPAFTYVSTAAVICFAGAKPVFADIDPKTAMLSNQSVATKMTSRTKAVIAVHYAGIPGPFDELRAWSRSRGLVMIEDGAHALGSLYADGRRVGSHADYTAFSFAATKPLPSCGGGLLVFADDTKRARLESLSMLGLTTDTFTRFNDCEKLPAQTVAELGYHYRINDVAAAIALAQVEELEMTRALRIVLAQHYFRRLEGFSGVELPVWPENSQPCWYLMPVRIDAAIRDKIRRALAEHQVDTSVHYPNLAAQAPFSSPATYLPNTERVSEAVLSLPLFGDMTLTDVDNICDTLLELIAN